MVCCAREASASSSTITSSQTAKVEHVVASMEGFAPEIKVTDIHDQTRTKTKTTLPCSSPVFAKNKHRPRITPASAVAPFPHEVNVVEPSNGHVRVQKRYFFSLRFGSWEIRLNFDPLGGEGRAKPRPVKNTPVLFVRKHRTRQNQCWGPCQCDRLLSTHPC